MIHHPSAGHYRSFGPTPEHEGHLDDCGLPECKAASTASLAAIGRGSSDSQPGPRADLKWLAIDLDGTLAEPTWRPDNPTPEIGPPIRANVQKAREAAGLGWKIVIHTARPWTDYEAIEWWCARWGVPARRIVCGKILAQLYIDDKGRHESAESWLP